VDHKSTWFDLITIKRLDLTSQECDLKSLLTLHLKLKGDGNERNGDGMETEKTMEMGWEWDDS